MPRVVLLRHLPADGPAHYDWLLSPGDGPYDPDDRVLLSFRVADRPDEIIPGDGFEAVRMVDHRWLYLDFEGEVSGGRGLVERVADGIWTPQTIEDDVITGEIAWVGRSLVAFDGRRGGSDCWRFQISPPHGR